ncbi:hypothetical protein C1Y63_10845 [Corynebacterium sp. 13CS0277]|uniref:CinA family protein n=1 Tax=Corynebacterium sp. 13CS0277 TaxID=2071994 RepID=UPI000D047A83|nr:CinA family protein [Corynebacterium sp. 13CS0277]PRQ10538.1 hypothetical protein C1Y63_10845 [Corynebacterium sp. 13CS0277]
MSADRAVHGGGVEALRERAEQLATQVVHAATAQGRTLATCESLTAGLVSATLASVSGASEVLRGGLVTYATQTKATLAGVAPEALAATGPVDPEVARQMAAGAARRLRADIGVALTGVAGPTTQDGHPVGEVWLGIATADAVRAVQVTPQLCTGGQPAWERGAVDATQLLQGGRDYIRLQAVIGALVVLLHTLGQTPVAELALEHRE